VNTRKRVKTQIDSRTKSLIQKIETYRETLFKEVDVYEIECKSNIETNKIHFYDTIKDGSE
jgi:hypothetical protein